MNELSPRTETASELAARLAAGEISSVELVEAALAKIASGRCPNAFITVTAETAMDEARASDARRARGAPLSDWDGLPVAWKDLFDFAGETTTAGAEVLRDAPPAQTDAALVALGAALGLVRVGKTNLSEFAYSGLGLNPHFGTPENPTCPGEGRAPGGSSSGSAVAVAAGIVPIAIGTDTAGSIRVPASFCGLWGYKASNDHLPSEGIFQLSSSLDSAGWFARSAQDLLQLDHLIHPALIDASAENPDFLVPDDVVMTDVEPDVLSRFEAFLEELIAAGFKVRQGPLPIIFEAARLLERHGTLTAAEAFTRHQALLESSDAERMDQRVRRRMDMARGMPVQNYVILKQQRARLRRAVARELGNSLLLFPTVAITAPSIAALEADDAFFAEVNLKALRNTMLGNYLETPGVTIPIGKDRHGLPIGALLSAPWGEDRRLLVAARTVELAMPRLGGS